MGRHRLRIGRWSLGGSAILAAALLAGRLSGLVREQVLAATLGLSVQADIAVVLLTLPDLLVNLLLSGGIGAALVPYLQRIPAAQGAALFRRATLGVAAAFALPALLLVLAPGWVFAALAPGLRTPIASLSWVPMVLVAATVVVTAATGVTTAYLNAHGRFGVAGCGTLIFNGAVVAALLVGAAANATLLGLAVGVLLGAVARWASQAVAARPLTRAAGCGAVPETPGLARSFMMASLAASVGLLVPVVVRSAASLAGAGAIAAFTYAQKLVELPAGIVVSAIATVALTRLSSLHAAGDVAGSREMLQLTVQRALLLTVTAAGLGVAFAEPLVGVLFGHGRMAPAAVERVAVLTRIAMLSVPAIALAAVATAALNARQQAHQALRMNLAALPVLVALLAWGTARQSEAVLMAAVVAFHLGSAALLGHAAGLRWRGEHGWLRPRIAAYLLWAALAVMAATLIDRMVAAPHPALRLLLAAAAGLIALAPARPLFLAAVPKPA